MTIKKINLFKNKIEELKAEQTNHLQLSSGKKLSVVILGAGPAGLIRGIQSIMHGHQTQIIEKRVEGEGRANTVALNLKTIEILKNYGVYQWLVEKHLIFPLDAKRPYISVQLQDLEKAMKAVILELTQKDSPPVICYGSKVTEIDSREPKTNLLLETTTGPVTIQSVDLIVNGEGSRSSTNELLNIQRQEVLPKVPVIAAVFKDNRPNIVGIGSFFAYIGKTLLQSATSVYYYAIFFFKFLFQGERFSLPERNIAGALILKTPGQVYLGCGFSSKHSEKLLSLKQDVDTKREALKNNPALKNELIKAEKKYIAFANYWIHLSFCSANVLTFLARFFKADTRHFENAGYVPLHSFYIAHIGADHATEFYKKMNKTAYVVSGDAMATVDPTTGLGANMAIQTSTYFEDLIDGMEKNDRLGSHLRKYASRSSWDVLSAHSESRALRRIYRPDAVEGKTREETSRVFYF